MQVLAVVTYLARTLVKIQIDLRINLRKELNQEVPFSWQEMRRDGRNVEKVVLSNALQLLLEDKVFVHGNKTVIL